MMPVDSKNVYGTPRLQSPNFTLKMSYLKYFSVSFGRCNLKVSAVFLEYIGIIEHCCAFGFLGTCQPLPCRRFKRTVWYSKLLRARISGCPPPGLLPPSAATDPAVESATLSAVALGGAKSSRVLFHYRRCKIAKRAKVVLSDSFTRGTVQYCKYAVNECPT